MFMIFVAKFEERKNILVRPDNLPQDLNNDHLMQRNYHMSCNVYDIRRQI